jgi:hypothetical protein
MRLGVTALVLLLAGSGVAQQREPQSGKQAFSAVALSAGGPRSNPVATQVDIVIERYSTESERLRLMSALTKGQDTLLDTLRDLPRVGYIRTPGTLAWDLHYAQQAPGEDGGRRIVLATDRPISTWEAIHQPLTIDYPFTFIELRLDNHGEGEGKLSRATRVRATDDGRFVFLENWEHQPVDLTQVKAARID